MEREDDARLRVPLAVIPGKHDLLLFCKTVKFNFKILTIRSHWCNIWFSLVGGTGNSFVLELQGEVKIKTAVQHIIRGLSVSIDISKVFISLFLMHFNILYYFIWFSSFYNNIVINRNTLLMCNRFSSPPMRPASTSSIHCIGVWPLTWTWWLNNSGISYSIFFSLLRYWLYYSWMGKAVRYTTASLMEVFKGEKTLAIIEMVDKGIFIQNNNITISFLRLRSFSFILSFLFRFSSFPL